MYFSHISFFLLIDELNTHYVIYEINGIADKRRAFLQINIGPKDRKCLTLICTARL